MAVIVLAGVVVVCGFFLYVLLQFRRDEKHLTRHERRTGLPIMATRRIVGPLLDAKEHRLGNPARRKHRGGSNHTNCVS